MITARATAILCWAVFFLSAPQSNQEKELEPYLDEEAYQVYAVMLPERWPWKHAKAEYLVIQSETRAYEPAKDVADLCVELEGDSLEVFGSVLEDYVRANRQPKRLVRAFLINKAYYLLNRREILSFFAVGIEGWQDFYGRYPRSGGYQWMSAVGFNKDKTRAIVHMDHSCGGRCGGGEYYFLEKIDGNWKQVKVKGRTCLWVS